MNSHIEFVRKLLNTSFVRFAMVGAVATGINYGVYLISLPIMRDSLPALSDKIYPTLSYIIAFAISVVCNFFLSSWFTFRVSPSWTRAVKFLTAHLINLLNELLLLNLFLWIGVSKYYAPLFIFAIAFPINFLMVRFALKGRFLGRLFQKR